MNEPVNQILLQTLALGNQLFSAAQLSALESIAMQCPLEGGEAVFRARDLLVLVQAPMVYDDYMNCSTPQPRDFSIHSAEGSVINLFPNPAKDQVMVRYDLKNTENALLQFFNPLGQMVKEVTLPGTSVEINVDLNGFDSGLYWFAIKGDGRPGKLIIKH